MVRQFLRKVRNGFVNPPRGPGRVGGHKERSGTGQGTFPEV